MKNLIILALIFFGVQKTDAQRRSVGGHNYYDPKPVMTPKIYAGSRGYYEVLPKDYYQNPTRKYPVLIFLHGAGEQGDGSADQLKFLTTLANTPPWYSSRGINFTFNYPDKSGNDSFILLYPQQNFGGWFLTLIQEIANQLVPLYASRTKADQIFITGLSLGGEGCYTTGDASVNDVFAAIAPMGGYNNGFGCALSTRKVAIWGFHGDADGTIPYANGLGAFQQTSLCVAPVPVAEMKFTTITGGSHSSSWNRGYQINTNQDNPNLYPWFLSKTKL